MHPLLGIFFFFFFCTLSVAIIDPPTILSLGTSHVFNTVWVAPTVVYILTNNASGIHQLYRSADEGLSWSLLSGTDIMPDPTGACYVMDIFQDPNDSLKLLFLGPASQQCGWQSYDGGVSYVFITPPSVQYIYFHPNNTAWAIGIDFQGGAAYWTEDLGTDWAQFYNSTMAAWLLPQDYDNYPLSGVYLIQGGLFGYSPDLGTTFIPEFPEWTAAFLYASSNFIYVRMQDQTLVVGTNRNNFQKAYFPFGSTVGVFSVTDDSSGATWFEHDESLFWGGLYSAGSSWTLYVPSLPHVLKRTDGFLDFFEVSGLPGVHIANTVLNFNDWRDLQLKTMITFNNGQTWSPLTPPAGGCAGCSLNLYFSHTTFGVRSFESSANAVGIIVANGNVGPALSYDDPLNLKTYLSRTGGQSWETLVLPYTGPSYFEFGDHGAVLVIAPLWQSTNVIYYSVDEGLHFFPYNISTIKIWVTKIQTEETTTSRKFFLYGLTDDNNGYGLVFGIDFSSLQPQPCQSTDYEQWSLFGKNCSLGQVVTYQRRQRTANCTNTLPVDPIVSIVTCPCTYADYECDFGYQQVAGSCVDTYRNVLPADCIGTFEDTQRYRIIPGDACVGGVDLRPFIATCPGYGPQSNSFIAVVVVLVLLFLAAISIVVAFQDPRIKQRFLDFTGLAGIKERFLESTGLASFKEKLSIFSFTTNGYNRVRHRSSSLAQEEDFAAHEDLLGNAEDDDAKILHDHDISKADISASPAMRSGSTFNPRNIIDEI